MNALIYLWKRTFANKIKKAVRKPVTYLYLLMLALYGIFLPLTFRVLLSRYGLDTAEGMVMLVTIFCFYLIPANLIAYAKRRGLIFLKADVNFLFGTPLNPKLHLLYSHSKTLGMSLLLGVVILVAGFIAFHLSAVQMLLYFAVSMVLDNILQASIMLLCYGSEKIKNKRRVIVTFAYALVGCFFVIAIAVYFKYGMSFDSVRYFLHSDAVQMVPFVGWYIAVMHLVFMGPTVVNVICSVCYLLAVGILLFLAVRMKCTGDYYEDAEKFADDYEEMKAKRLEGSTEGLGKKKKLRKAKVVYKGGGAKAIFYKQLLEYKKAKTFFLDKTNLILIVIGNIWAYMLVAEDKNTPFKIFLMPMIMAYLAICASAMNGKWGKEIKSPYTFLIPEGAMKKLWYATLMEHIKSLVYGALFAVPCSVLLEIPFPQTVLCILVYMMLHANKLYSLVMMEAWVGSTLGRVGKQLFHMFLQFIPMMLASIGALIGVFAASMEVGYIFMSLVLAACAVVFMALASLCFDRMETAQ